MSSLIGTNVHLNTVRHIVHVAVYYQVHSFALLHKFLFCFEPKV